MKLQLKGSYSYGFRNKRNYKLTLIEEPYPFLENRWSSSLQGTAVSSLSFTWCDVNYIPVSLPTLFRRQVAHFLTTHHLVLFQFLNNADWYFLIKIWQLKFAFQRLIDFYGIRLPICSTQTHAYTSPILQAWPTSDVQKCFLLYYASCVPP